jgi:hypothetical protein
MPGGRYVMSDQLLIEIEGVAVGPDVLELIGEHEVIFAKRFEGHTDLTQVIVPLAATAYMTISRVLAFMERVFDKTPEKNSA